MTDSVDPKKVLKIINSMGYKNVSVDQLKSFTKDLKKLIKYESKPRQVEDCRVRNAPENVVNVTIFKEFKPTNDSIGDKCLNLTNTIPKSDKETQSMDTKSSRTKHGKNGKKVLQLKKHKKTKNANIIFKRSDCGGSKDGILVRNTPTDLYQKYSNDWAKFKSLIPGENSRENVRKSIRAKMQQKEDEQPKVYVHFPDN